MLKQAFVVCSCFYQDNDFIHGRYKSVEQTNNVIMVFALLNGNPIIFPLTPTLFSSCPLSLLL